MANFAAVQGLLEGVINNQLTASRQTQGVWEWYNALQRIVSQNRFTGTVRVTGPVTLSDTAATAVATGAAKLFGVLVDNSNAAEAIYVSTYDIAQGSVTAGTSIFQQVLLVPSVTMSVVLFPQPHTFATALSAFAGTGTNAGIEGGTGITGTNPTVVWVYTE